MLTRLLVGVMLLGVTGCSRSGDSPTVGPLGGVRERDGARIDIPAGALKNEQPIAITRVSSYPTAPADKRLLAGVFELSPQGQQFEQAVIVSVPAVDGDVLMKADLGGTWTVVPGATFEDGKLIAPIRKLSFLAAATAIGTADRIFFSDGAAVRSMGSDGSGLKTIVPGVLFDQYPTGIAIDRVAQRFYWTDNITDRVTRVAYDGSGPTVLYASTNALSNPTGLAIDVPHGKLFWAEGSNVRSSNLDGSGLTNVITGGGSNLPTSVALDPVTQRVYWTDNGTDTVNRADYSGANATVLYTSTEATANPRGLAIDLTNSKLFWAEGAGIRSSLLDGTFVTTVIAGVASTHVPDAIAVDPTRKLLYWTDNGTDAVHVAPYSGVMPKALFQNLDKFSNPQGIAIDPGN